MFLSVKQLTYLSLFLGMLWAQFDFNIPKAGDNVTIQQKNGTVSASAEDATLTLHGNVNVTSGQGLELEARSIQINNKTKEIKLTGNVRIYQGPLTHTGSSALINEESQTIDTRNLQTRLVKVFIKADQIKSLKQGDDTIYYAKDAILTTHDSDKPHWWLSAKEMEVYPSGLIKLKRVTYKINGHPIFWLPFFYKGNSSDLGYTAQAGIDSIWGAFWLSRYGVHIFENQKWAQNEDGSPKVVAQAHLDILSSRGLGHGLTFLEQSAESRELSEWRFYGISDGNTTESRNGVDREPIDSYRNLLQAKQRFYFGDRQTLDFNITALSDRFYLEDFSPSTALHERELNNQITWSNYPNSAMIKPTDN